MVSRRDIGILALLGIGAFVLSRGLSTKSFGESAPAIPLSIVQGQALQEQFDQLGDEIESRDVLLGEQTDLLKNLQNFITNFLNPIRGGLNQSAIPSGALLGIGQAPFTRTSTGRDIIVATFGKVPSNFRQ